MCVVFFQNPLMYVIIEKSISSTNMIITKHWKWTIVVELLNRVFSVAEMDKQNKLRLFWHEIEHGFFSLDLEQLKQVYSAALSNVYLNNTNKNNVDWNCPGILCSKQ